MIYALPNQTLEEVKEDLAHAFALDIKHLSIYSLQIEENSVFGKWHILPVMKTWKRICMKPLFRYVLNTDLNIIEIGYFDLYTKGGKLRRLYIPKKLKKETLEWLEETHRFSGYLFLNRYGERITTRGISQQLKNYAEKYGLDKKVVYPHSFRHRYAKNFLEKYNDIALLADLMGHESIETTRIYLRRTASEQQELVDKIVTW